MTKHKKQYNELVYPIFNEMYKVVEDDYWKQFFKGLEINTIHKGIRIMVDNKHDGNKNFTVITIRISNGSKKNQKSCIVEIKEGDDIKIGANKIIEFMEESSILYSTIRNNDKLKTMKNEAASELNSRRKIDRSIFILKYLSNILKSNKAIKRAYNTLINIGTIKSSETVYDNDGNIIGFDKIKIDDNGTIKIDDLKEKEESIKDRILMSYYIEKIIPEKKIKEEQI